MRQSIATLRFTQFTKLDISTNLDPNSKPEAIKEKSRKPRQETSEVRNPKKKTCDDDTMPVTVIGDGSWHQLSTHLFSRFLLQKEEIPTPPDKTCTCYHIHTHDYFLGHKNWRFVFCVQLSIGPFIAVVHFSLRAYKGLQLRGFHLEKNPIFYLTPVPKIKIAFNITCTHSYFTICTKKNQC